MWLDSGQHRAPEGAGSRTARLAAARACAENARPCNPVPVPIVSPSVPTPRSRLQRDARIIARLGGPLLANNLAIAGMGFADTVMAGRLGADALATVALGSAVYNLWMFVGLGVLMGLSPVVAHAWGAGEERRIGSHFRQALWLALGLSVVVGSGIAHAHWLLGRVGIEPELVASASRYCKMVAVGMPALMSFFALRFMTEGIGWTRPIMYIACAGLATNVFGNWVFMYGRLGAPALGAVGCGVASAIVMWVMAAAMLAYVSRHRIYRPLALFDRFEWPDPSKLRELAAVGVPIAGSIVSEGGLFVAAALLMGTFGATAVAAHQVAINYATFMFMVPLALHSATTIRVGQLLGRGDYAAARFSGYVGIGLCAAVMLASALGILVSNDLIAALYTSDAAVRELAATMLLLAALFQVSDGVQVGAAGALRGYKDTRVPMLLNLGSYWLVGFPVAWVLGVVFDRGPLGIWLGLVAGLTLCALLLLARYACISTQRAGGASICARTGRNPAAGRRSERNRAGALEPAARRVLEAGSQ